MIDLFRPYVPKEAIEAVTDTLRTRWIGQGPKVDQFEKKFKGSFIGMEDKFAVALNSGTAALETAYDLIGLKAGDEVITTPLTCTATNIPLLRRGCKLIFADILENSLCIDPLDVHSKMSEKTKAIVQVHVGGMKSDVGVSHIPVVSDACQALGIFTGDYTCCSFQAIKHLTTGDGGVLAVRSKEEYRKSKLLRWFGIDREKKVANQWQAYRERKMTFDIELPGMKRQMNDIAAAMGIVGLDYYSDMINYRRHLLNIYRKELKDVDGIKVLDGKMNTCWLATVLVERRDKFAKAMFEADIDTNVVQVRNDIYKLFGGKRQDLPTMNAIENKYLSLPLGMHVSVDDVYYICETIKEGW